VISISLYLLFILVLFRHFKIISRLVAHGTKFPPIISVFFYIKIKLPEKHCTSQMSEMTNQFSNKVSKINSAHCLQNTH